MAAIRTVITQRYRNRLLSKALWSMPVARQRVDLKPCTSMHRKSAIGMAIKSQQCIIVRISWHRHAGIVLIFRHSNRFPLAHCTWEVYGTQSSGLERGRFPACIFFGNMFFAAKCYCTSIGCTWPWMCHSISCADMTIAFILFWIYTHIVPHHWHAGNDRMDVSWENDT